MPELTGTGIDALVLQTFNLTPLAYVQPLELAPHSGKTPVNCIDMSRFRRVVHRDGRRQGLIIPLTQIWRPVEVIPAFGNECESQWSCNTAVELAQLFIINNYFSIEDFMTIYY